MSVALDAYPQPRPKRSPPSTSPAPPPAAATIPRMRIFSLARPAYANLYNVMVSPRCQGPAIIKDIILRAPLAVVAGNKGLKIFISDNNGDGVIDSAGAVSPSGDPIHEDLLFKYVGQPPAGSPYLHGYTLLNTAVGEIVAGTVIPLDYPVNRTSFFIKVYIILENQRLEGQIRVLEGVDLTRFF